MNGRVHPMRSHFPDSGPEIRVGQLWADTRRPGRTVELESQDQSGRWHYIVRTPPNDAPDAPVGVRMKVSERSLRLRYLLSGEGR